MNPVARALRAFTHRDFRLFFSGHFLSLIGTWMQHVAMSWLVYRLTGSALALGAIGFVSQFPSFAIAPFAGVLADRWSRRRIVLGTQLIGMVQAVALAVLTLTGAIEVWHLFLLATVLGIANGFDIPARQALLVELVEGTEDLANAIALNSSMFNAARLVGPAIAGVLIGLIGEGMVFLINALSYVGILTALLALGAGARSRVEGKPRVLHHLREGFRYAWRFEPIRALLLLLALVSLVGLPYSILLPVFASEQLGGDAQTLGLLLSANGFGALVGALYLASRISVRGLSRVILTGGALFGLTIAAFALSTILWLSLLMMFVAGIGVMTTTASINTILQTIVEEDKRGRIMSMYTMAFMGMTPFGSLLAGAAADYIGAPFTVAIGGVLCIAATVWFGRIVPRMRELVHPIYVEKGIIPEVATGIGSVSEIRGRG